MATSNSATLSTTESTNATAHDASGIGQRAGGLGRWDLWAGVAPLVLMLPMLVAQAVALGSRTQMRFAFVVFVVVAILSVLHMRGSSTTRHPVRWWAAIGLLGFSTLLYGWAVWTFSPWLAHVSCVGAFCGWALGRWGSSSWAHVGAVTILLLTTLPLPWNWDQSLDGSLKNTATSAASGTLDTFNVPNIFVNGSLSTEFSRIDALEMTTYGSVFALIAFGCGLCVVRHRSLLHAILLTVLAFFIYVTTVFLALCVAVYLRQEHQFALLPEYWLGVHLTVFLVALALMALLDVLLALMFHPVPVTDPDFFPIFSFGNKLLFWPHEDPQESMVPEDPDELELYEQRKLAEEQNKRVWPVTNWSELSSMRWPVYVTVATMLLASLAPWWLLLSGSLLGRESAFRVPTELELEQGYPGAETLPARLGSWQKTDFRTYVDEVANLEWRFNWRGQTVTARVSFPQTSPIALSQVRSGEGWRPLGMVPLKDARGVDSLEFTQWINALGSRNYMLSSALDSKLKPRSRFDGIREARNKPASVLMSKLDPEPLRLSDMSCWVVAECEAGLDLRDEELRDFQMSFEVFRDAIAKALTQEKLESLMSTGEGAAQ